MILTLSLALRLLAPSTSIQAADRTHPVYTVFMRGIAAFNAHRIDEFLGQFDAALEMYTADAGWVVGRESARRRFESTFARFPKAHMDIEKLRVRAIAPTVALVTFEYAVKPQGVGPAYHGIGTGVYLLDRTGWHEVAEHESTTSVDAALQRSP